MILDKKQYNEIRDEMKEFREYIQNKQKVELLIKEYDLEEI